MDARRWFYLESQQPRGPATEAELLRMLRDGEISGRTMVWVESEANWQSASVAIPSLAFAPPPLPSLPADRFERTRDPAYPRLTANQSERLESTNRVQKSPGRDNGSNWSDRLPHPWRRYFARQLDIIVNGTLGFAVFCFVLAALDWDAFQHLMALLNKPENEYLSVWLAVLAAIPANSVLTGFTGVTLGKWLFGIRVLERTGAPIGFMKALRRERFVWLAGLAAGLAPFAFFTLWRARNKLRQSGSTGWDDKLDLLIEYRAPGPMQALLTSVGLVLILVLPVTFRTLA